MSFDFSLGQGRIEEIRWIDSAAAHGWSKLDDENARHEKHRGWYDKSCLCVSVGYVYREDEQSVYLTMSHSGDGYVSCTAIIPKRVIVARRCLAEGDDAQIKDREQGRKELPEEVREEAGEEHLLRESQQGREVLARNGQGSEAGGEKRGPGEETQTLTYKAPFNTPDIWWGGTPPKLKS